MKRAAHAGQPPFRDGVGAKWITPSVLAVVAIIAGCIVMVGWVFDIAVLKSLLPGWVGMKPNAALAFILIGTALLFFSHRSSWASRLAKVGGWVAGWIGLLTLMEYGSGWHPGFDQWLFAERVGTVGTIIPGRMAPDAALCFLLLAVGLGLVGMARRRKGWLIASAVPAMLVLAVALVVILSYCTPDLRMTGWYGLTVMAFPSAILFLLLGTAMFMIVWRNCQPKSALPEESMDALQVHAGIRFLFVFFLLATVILTIGGFYFRNYEKQCRAEADRQFSALVDSKVVELTLWRLERQGDGNTFFGNRAFSALVRDFLEKPEGGNIARELQLWFINIQDSYEYERVFLLDVHGSERLAIPSTAEAEAAHLAQEAAKVLQSGRVALTDFHRHGSDPSLSLEVLVPIFDESNVNRPLGVVGLHINPKTYLYPFLKRWPLPSRTVETILVRRDGTAALSLSLPMERTDVSFVRTVFDQTGIIQGVDQRGVTVLAASRPIPDSPWMLVSKMDAAEALGPLHDKLLDVLILIGALLVSAAAGVGLVWHQQRAQFYQERAKIAQALNASEMRIRSLFEMPLIGICITSPAKGWLEVNDRLCAMLGYDSSELVATTWAALTHPDDLAADATQFERVLLGEMDGYSIEKRFIRKNGEIIHADLAVRCVRLEDQSVDYFVALIQDITERKRDEELRFRLAAIVEFSDDGIIGKDLNGIITSWNHGAEKIFGYTADEMVGTSIVRLIPADRQDEERQILEQIRRGESVEHFETERQTKDGRSLSVSITASPIQDAAGRIIGVSKIVRDITDRMRTEAIWRAQMHLIAFATHHSLDELLEETLNEAEKLSGSVIGFYHFVEEDQKNLTLQNWSTRTKAKFCRAEGKGMHYSIDQAGVWVDCVHERKPVVHNDYASLPHRKGLPEGHATVIRQLVVPVMRGEQVVAILGVGNKPIDYDQADIESTSLLADLAWEIAFRKRAEEEVRHLNASLEQRVLDRTAELTTLNRELESFSYSVSHDLRAPLRSIDGFSRILLEDYADKLDAEGKDSLQRVRAATQRMGHLIDDLLQLAYLARSDMSPAEVDLSALARIVANGLQKADPQRRVEFVIEPHLSARVDVSLMRVVLENLFGNAWKFTGNQVVAKIEFGLTMLAGAPTYYVRDNGVGFDMDYAGKLFGAFQRLHSAVDFPGTGVGLATVQRVIHRHNGRVWAEGRVNQGATFYFTLPELSAINQESP